MTHSKIGLALLVASWVASSVMGGSAAAAPPELLNKLDETITKSRFTGEGTTKSALQIRGEGLVTCEKTKEAGEVTGAKSAKVTATWTGCEYSKSQCNTAGAKAGEVLAEASDLYVYVLLKEEVDAAVLRTLTKELPLECGGQTLKVKGSALLRVNGAEELTEKFKLNGEQSEGLQKVLEYEEVEEGTKRKASLETLGSGTKSFGYTQSGVSLETTLSFSQGIQIIFPQGPYWVSGGGRLVDSEKTVSISNKGPIEIKSTNGEIKLECSGAEGSGDIIGGDLFDQGTGKYKLTLTGCVDKAEPGCEVISYANREGEERPAGNIGGITVKSELAYPGNTGTRATAANIFLPSEENGASEKVFVVVMLRKKGAEPCNAESEGRASIIGTGGPAAVLDAGGAALAKESVVESIELNFPATPYTRAQRWVNSYRSEPLETRWAIAGKEQRPLEIEGILTISMMAMKFGWQ